MSITRFSQADIVVSTDALVTSTWSNNVNNLQTAHTASVNNLESPTSSGWFHLDVYNSGSTDAVPSQVVGVDDEVQYSIGYGNRLGSGSPDFTNDSGSHGMNASRATYGAYRNLVYGDEAQNFTFGTHVPEDIWVINVTRARYKQSLKPGTLNLHLSASLTSSTQTSFIYHLSDDSVTENGSSKLTNLGRQFNIVSGASGIRQGNTLYQVGGSASFGLFYPDAGVIILNPDAFGQNQWDHINDVGYTPAGVTVTTATSGSYLTPNRRDGSQRNYDGVTWANGFDKNPFKLFRAISGAGHFIVDSQEKITSQYYFARAKNFEYNYTTNPSFCDTAGNLTYSSMINNPVTYITTIGLYNDSNDLVAVAKLSQPVVKDFTKEALIRVKLDY